MNYDYDKCPGCGNRVSRGAMRCTRCGRLLTTPEEQLERIKKLKQSRKGFNIAGLIKFFAFLIAAGVIYYFFSDRIAEFIRGVLR